MMAMERSCKWRRSHLHCSQSCKCGPKFWFIIPRRAMMPKTTTKNNNNNNNAETAVANSGNLTDTTLDSTSSQPHSKTRFWRMQQPFSEVAPYLGSFFNIHCACVDIDHVLDVEEEFENQVFLQAKAARILKRKAVDMKQLKFGRQLGQGGKDFIMTHTYIEYAI